MQRRSMAGPDMARPADRRPRIFADRKPVAATHFQLDSQGLSPEEEALLLPVSTPRVLPPQMALADVIGTAANEAIVNAGKMAFHAVGDTGAVCRSTLPDEEAVTDAMSADLTADLSPSFLFHLGD